jgi:hypothetical protein
VVGGVGLCVGLVRVGIEDEGVGTPCRVDGVIGVDCGLEAGGLIVDYV